MIVASLLAVLLGGCVNTTPVITPVKDFNQNRENYVQEEFDPAKLAEGIRSPIELAFAGGKKFNKMVLEYDVMATNNGIARPLTSSATVYGREHGMVLYQNEFSANGIPYRVNNGIQLLGITSLDYQDVFLQWKNSARSPREFVIKKIDSIDPSPVEIKADSSFTLKFRSGRREQVSNFYSFTSKFKFGRQYPAAQVNPAFQGDALDCEVEQFNEAGVIVSRLESIYLLNYGTSIWVRYFTSREGSGYSLKSVRIE